MKKLFFVISMLLLLISGRTQRTITGLVTDISGNPIPGVNIQVKGTTSGTMSDAAGKYNIGVPDKSLILVFSFVGFKTQDVNIGNSNVINVVMEEDVVSLSEVVVMGYATQSKSSVTGSIASISYNDERATRKSKSCYQPVPEFNTEGYSAIHENGFKNPLNEPLSTFSIDVDAASYSNVRRFIMEGQKPVTDAVRIEEMINYFDYDYPQPDDGNPFAIVHELGVCPWNKDNLLLHIGLQGMKLEKDEAPASNLVFLLDVSGSMNDPNKLPLVVKAMKMLVGQLREEDKVAIVVYAGSSGLVLPSTHGNEKTRIIEALERLQAGGSTAGSAGLKLAYEVAEKNFIREGNNRIILATDGDFNVGPSSNAEMERMIENYRNKGIFISVCGFGMGNYKDDKMEIIADKGNGNYSYIDNLMEAKKVFVNEFSSTLFTIAKDVKIQIEFNPAYVKEYRLVGYENRLLNEEDFENDAKDAGELGAGHTVTALYEIVTTDKPGYRRQLKYQENPEIKEKKLSGELATIKFRYKKPDGERSILMTEVISNSISESGQTSDNFRFSAAVAGFGMLLRHSEYDKNLQFEDVIAMAREAKGKDKDGYRAEFIRLVEMAEGQ